MSRWLGSGEAREDDDMTDDIAAFVRARLDEDERHAHNAQGLIGVVNPWWTWQALKSRFPSLSRADTQHIERHSPARVLREVAALRAVVELHGRAHPCPAYDRYGDGPAFVEPAPWQVTTCCDTLRGLAAIWSDHPEYQQEWRLLDT